jgi:hypothetical protein
MHVPIQPHRIVYKIIFHVLAGQVLPWSQFWWHGGHFRSMKSCSLTHVLSTNPQAGPVSGVSNVSSGFIKYLKTNQAITSALNINIE